MNQNQQIITALKEADTKAFLEKLNEPIFKAADMPISYRVISHWHQKNLFPKQKEAGQWRMFSTVDYLWILFMIRLRMLNVGLVSMAKIKEQCFASIYPLLEQHVITAMLTSEPGVLPEHLNEGISILRDPGTKESLEAPEFRLFSFWLMLAIKNNADVLIRIQADKANTTEFVMLLEEKTDTEKLLKTIAQKGGLFISIQALQNEFYGQERFRWENMAKLEIDKEARTVIALMREKGLKQIVVKLDSGSVKHVQTEKMEKHMSLQEFNNAVVANQYAEYRIVKYEGENLIVSAKHNFRLKDGQVY